MAVALCVGPVSAADRVALVIGNAAYQTEKPLTNPVNDAADVSVLLRKLGFEVIEATDLDKRNIERKTREFRDKLQSSSMALLFYAGHGIQVEGRNYVLPIDARIEKASDVPLEAVDLDTIMQQMRGPDPVTGEERIKIVILDACRDNPYARTVSRSLGGGTRAAQGAFEGLAEIKSSGNSIIIYATDPGNVASDGTGRNSPFTEALLKHAARPGLDISLMVRAVRVDVTRATQHKQSPWDTSSLTHEAVYLAGGTSGAGAPQMTALAGAGAAARNLGVSGTAGSPAPQPGNRPSPADNGATCDRLASDKQDPLRAPQIPVVRNVDTEAAIPVCEKAVEAAPTVLRYANQLGRAYLAANRHEDALRIFKDAADRGSGYATAEMGFLNFRGLAGMEKNYPAARLWWEKAARLGVPVAMSNLAYMFERGIGGEKDFAKARGWFQRGLALNDTHAIIGLGLLYRDGKGVPEDDVKAKEMFVKAASLDDPEGYYLLGTFAQLGLAGPKDYDEARRNYELAAAAGHALSMAKIGFLYREGDAGVPVDFKIAREWFARSAKLNHHDGHFGLAMLYRYGEGIEKDLVKARQHLEEAARHDDTDSIRVLAGWLVDGVFGAPEQEAAIKWLRRAVDLHDERAREQLALLERSETPGETCDRLAAEADDPLRPANVKPVTSVNGAKAAPVCEAAVAAAPEEVRYLNQLGRAYLDLKRYDDARRVFEKAAGQRSALAAIWVGNILSRGLGMTADKRFAASWYEKAAELGESAGMTNLGVAYLKGDGVLKDVNLAKAWFEKGVEAGNPESISQMGWLYYRGNGVTRDYTLAREWFEKAAAKRHAASMDMLGDIHRDGEGIAQNFKTARQWYAQAAEAGNTDSMQSLADLYIAGKGGPRELQKARGLLEQAAGTNDASAITKLGQALLAGAFGEVEEENARKWLQKAADLGNKTAREMLAENTAANSSDASQGDLCDRYAGIREDPLSSASVPSPAMIDTAKAIPACTSALARSPATLRFANQLGHAYVKADRYFDAMRIFRAAADKGSAFAMLWVGNLHARGFGVAKDAAQAAIWYEKAAENGFATAAYNLAIHYKRLFTEGENKGQGEDKSRAQNAGLTFKWFEKSAMLADEDAMFQLSVLYRDGVGVPASETKEIEWLEKAADSGSAEALNALGVKHYFGRGVAENETTSRELFERAVAAGNTDAHYYLAHHYLKGLGGEPDKPKARKLLETGAAKKDVSAIIYLAEALRDGEFGQPDRNEARRLLRFGADLGSDKARKILAEMK